MNGRSVVEKYGKGNLLNSMHQNSFDKRRQRASFQIASRRPELGCLKQPRFICFDASADRICHRFEADQVGVLGFPYHRACQGRRISPANKAEFAPKKIVSCPEQKFGHRHGQTPPWTNIQLSARHEQPTALYKCFVAMDVEIGCVANPPPVLRAHLLQPLHKEIFLSEKVRRGWPVKEIICPQSPAKILS